MWIFLFDQLHFACSIPLLDLFLSRDRASYVFMKFIIDQELEVVLFGKALDLALLVLPHSAHEVIRNADIECSVAPACEDVNRWLFFHDPWCQDYRVGRETDSESHPSLDSRFHGNDDLWGST